MKVKAKFVVDSITHTRSNPSARVVKLSPVCADGVPENERYHRYTPSGSIEMYIDNPPAAEFFTIGSEIYVDFTKVEQS
jgi:hypothetical protein